MTGKPVYAATSDREKGLQKALLLWHQPAERAKVLEALEGAGAGRVMRVCCGGAWSCGYDAGTLRSTANKKLHTKKAR